MCVAEVFLSAAIQAKMRWTTFSAERSCGRRSRPRRGWHPSETVWGLLAYFLVHFIGVAIEDGLQVDLGPPSQQDPLE